MAATPAAPMSPRVQVAPPPGSELLSGGLGCAPGGVANVAGGMSRLGLRVGLGAAVGDDLLGACLWRTLQEQEGVDLRWSRQVTGWPTPVTVSLAYDSDRSMITYAPPPPIDLAGLVVAPPRARTCLVGLDIPIPGWALEMRRNGATVFADVSWGPTEAWAGDGLDRGAALEHLPRTTP